MKPRTCKSCHTLRARIRDVLKSYSLLRRSGGEVYEHLWEASGAKSLKKGEPKDKDPPLSSHKTKHGAHLYNLAEFKIQDKSQADGLWQVPQAVGRGHHAQTCGMVSAPWTLDFSQDRIVKFSH